MDSWNFGWVFLARDGFFDVCFWLPHYKTLVHSGIQESNFSEGT